MTDQDKLDAALLAEETLEEVERLIRETGAQLLEAASEDLARFANRLALQLVWAHANGSDEAIASIKRQAVLLAELQRIRVTDAAWDTFYKVVDRSVALAVRVATSLLLAGVTKLADTDD